ncbi:1,4-alpha-glucan branching protein domain-containing protein [Cohnella sp. CFH 77786]|uniref:1,4-alpha-glucan branching protein domain-containing protein n=1 Tax=Cohnella sp. CFH 77786 TaxID=2662265 RepID=UPI001C60A0CD|nr:1,4-alpha-glucan branching protein domain-containing protein [Cohnella sp. CFH 77786]
MSLPPKKKPGGASCGCLMLVLHLHLPYIRHHDRDDYLEERWFYESMLETYLPLLDMAERLAGECPGFRLTLGMTPTLLAMLEDPLMQGRFLNHLERLIELADKETGRLANDPVFLPLARRYAERFRSLRSLYLGMEMKLIPRFADLQRRGFAEIVTSAATHAFLPLCKTEEAIRAQIATAVRDYERHFGRRPSGMWLPECGYTSGIDRILKELGISYTFVEAAGVRYASPPLQEGLIVPRLTRHGVAVFPRDPESSLQVWSAAEGYPGDEDYREYYRDIGWDLGWESESAWGYIRPYLLADGTRVNTGIKYYRITGREDRKEPYDPERAAAKVRAHAEHFVRCRERQAEEALNRTGGLPLITAPYDAELFGHWWHEGPEWLETVCRMLSGESSRVRLVLPSEYLAGQTTVRADRIEESSWGRNASAEVWLQGGNDWIYRYLHQAEERMIRLATHYRAMADRDALSPWVRRTLNQAARELMLAQSSDWAFIMDGGTVVEYAVRRTKGHLERFGRLCEAVERDKPDPAYLAELERASPLFPDLRFEEFASVLPLSPVSILTEAQWLAVQEQTRGRRNVFMLAWEYPPHNVGGLSRSVYEFSKALARRGEAVHVVTTAHYGSPYFELSEGVCIHRVPVVASGPTDFWDWMFEMNLAMIDHLLQWLEAGGRIDVVHAHDWMVYYTASEMKSSFGLPFVATFHATEWGRTGGRIESELQRRIHRLESWMAAEADRIVVCSRHMADEIRRLFEPSESRIHIIPNGIDMDAGTETVETFVVKEGPTVFYVGRLVFEKGVHVLLHAVPHVLAQVPDARFVIAGAGPMEAQLREQAAPYGDRVKFLGHVDASVKEAWLKAADAAVVPSLYEPFGIVALEAIRHRTPLVVSDTGGLAEIIDHGEDGFKALPGHVDSLVQHLAETLLNPDRARSMADRAYRKTREMYDMPVLAERLSRLYPIPDPRGGVSV